MIKHRRAPDHLNEAGCEEWNRIIAIFEARKLLDDLHLSLLEGYCSSYGAWVAARKEVREKGQVMKDKNGRIMRNPYIDIASQHLREWRKIALDLGMTELASQGAELGLGGAEPIRSRSANALFGLPDSGSRRH
jgi:P27 family predicted phage terminase small subunit